MQLKMIDVPDSPDLRRKSVYQRFKIQNNYRRSESENRCINCINAWWMHEVGVRSRRHLKCSLIGFSHCPATDINQKNVCNLHRLRNSFVKVYNEWLSNSRRK